MENFKDWLNKIIEADKLCSQYIDKVQVARNKKQIADIGLDANGACYLCKMQSLGYELPYEVIKKEFAPFINGRYIAKLASKNGGEYSSATYCEFDEKTVIINATITTFLGCSLAVYIPEYSYSQLYVDGGSKITIHCPKNAHCMVDFWDGAEVAISEDSEGKVKLKKR